ncbi:MAG: lamin tail domain-containing protein [Marmoricola sp.]
MTRTTHLVSVLAVASASALVPVTASAASPDVVVSEVYGGGGNSGAPYANDFVELRNDGGSAVDLGGWTVQYASASGTSWTPTDLAGTIAPGSSYLVQLHAGSSGGAALPTPDATGSTNMSSSSGKVALVTSGGALACGAQCAGSSGVRDFVGYGSANDSESSPAPSLGNITSDQRGANDTDDNVADFTEAAPDPQNSGSGGGGTSIHDIQGAAHVSPMNGDAVQGVTGVVTEVGSNGFWMQDPDPDSDPATSEGVFVFTSTAPTVSPGDAVSVDATVSEYRGSTSSLSTTELASPTVTVTGTGRTLPAATLVGSGGRVPPASVIEDDASGSVETSGTFDPAQDGIDFWESMEGMRVTLSSPAVVGPRSSYGEIPVVPRGSGTSTDRGGIVARADDFNPERVMLDDRVASTPSAQVGDTLSGDVTGVIDYSGGNFTLDPATTPTVVSGGLTQEVTATPTSSQLEVGTFNVENLDPTDAQSKFDGLAGEIVHNLKAPDVVALEEVQDNNGATDDGTVSATTTLTRLTDAISTAGGPSYSWREIDPVNDQDGREPGGNIRCVLLFRTDRGLQFVDRGTPSSTTGTAVTGSGSSTHLTISPGRVDPGNSAWASTRKPLAGEFTWNGQTVFVIANHLSSKGGDDPLFGRYQPPVESSAAKRHQQAQIVRGFADQLLAANPNARVVVVGDMNDYDFSQTADILAGTGSTALTDLPRTLPVAERYTYDYQGNSEVLDHILISPALASGSWDYDVVHTNAEFAHQLSDHDPQVVRLQ